MPPMPTSSIRTSRDMSKCHAPTPPTPMKTLFFSSSVANLNRKMLSPILSILTSFTLFHACCIAAFNPSLLMLCVSTTFPTRQFATTFSHFIFILPMIVIMSSSSSFIVTAWHFRINSSVSIMPEFPAIRTNYQTFTNQNLKTQKNNSPFNQPTKGQREEEREASPQ